jgi:hypothetical protein
MQGFFVKDGNGALGVDDDVQATPQRVRDRRVPCAFARHLGTTSTHYRKRVATTRRSQ